MSSELLDFFKAAYENDSACVFIFDRTFSLIWQNGKDAPFDKNCDIKTILNLTAENLPASGDYSYCIDSTLYDYHLINVSDNYFIVSCSCTPSFLRLIEGRQDMEAFENALTNQFISTHGISAAASALNDLFDETDCSEDSAYKLHQQLNIIMGHCSHILKEHYIQKELLRYQNQEDDSELFSCAELLESFTKQCRNILSIKNGEPIICHANPDTSVFISRDRFEFMMLCLLLDLHKDSDDIHQINVYAQGCDDTVSIVLSLTPVGEAKELPHIISEFTPLYKSSPSFTTEHMIIDAFCRRYNASLMRNKHGDSRAYCLRIPAADISQGMELHSYKPEKEKQIITPYHAMLFDISDFRYY